MQRKRGWTREQLIRATEEARSIRQILSKLGLREAGGNYAQIKKYIKFYQINTSHLKGHAWNKGLSGYYHPQIPLERILVKDSNFQSFNLKNRLFNSGIKIRECEECGWAKTSEDGRIPLELDHINGDNKDNRIENLRILCPNCHSLKLTHRGRNIKKSGQVVERQTLDT